MQTWVCSSGGEGTAGVVGDHGGDQVGGRAVGAYATLADTGGGGRFHLDKGFADGGIPPAGDAPVTTHQQGDGDILGGGNLAEEADAAVGLGANEQVGAVAGRQPRQTASKSSRTKSWGWSGPR
jgi:hypothetical protein